MRQKPTGFTRVALLAALWGTVSLAVPAESEDSSTKTQRTYKLKPPPREFSPALLVIPEPVWDWGTAYRGEKLEHTFVIENHGGVPLVIEKVKPQCGCTFAENYKKVLPPGGKTSLTLTLETGALKGDDEKQKYTEILTNGLAKDDNKLWMKGEVQDLLELDPAKPRVEAILGRAASDPPATVRVEANLRKELSILSARARKGLVKATLKPLSGGAYEVAMVPRLDASDRSAFQDDMIDLQVQVEGKKTQLSFPVTIHLLERISVNPSRSVYFPRKVTRALRTGGEGPKKILDIQSIGGPAHRFKITDIKKTSPAFDTALETVEEGRHYRLTVSVKGLPEKGKRFLKCRIELKTDDPEVPLLKIPATAQF